ncbi:uncharacterized protein LOC129611593 [Condylostylus longicornis]|uniref:uncharacterized protein LOC129611593 n=1 Tax=Condylostylus longicornis TaxID=2530218 RepID=UPI00244E1D2C|nr:uncharacterized protein LOC129611593 [Condylostylus longicornis]
MIRLVLFAFLIGAAVATEFKACKSGPSPIAVRVEGCDSLPCNVVSGTTVSMEIDFTVGDNDASKLQTKVRATAFGVTVPYKLPGDIGNVCLHLDNDQECPLDAGEGATYLFSLPIGKYPEIGVAVEVDIKNQNDQSVSCFIADIKVKSS